MYKYELHLHTKETSRCGHVRAADQVKTYYRLGYQGLCVTDHLHNTYLSTLDSPDNWEKCMDMYLTGYRNAKKAGEALGMDIILGCELRFPENESDYLLYGIDEQWLYDHPFICRMDHQSFFDAYGKEILIIHAHPYRKNDTVYYECVHGLEVVNCNPRHDSRNELALKLAKEHPYLYRTVGSDAHQIGDEGRGAILCKNRITDSYEMKDVITSGNFELWCPGNEQILQECEAIKSV
ncbi:MAG: PHP domain-containing protein [Clostridia bacterium]|nr:PHP domain-containing protein [Clostridia bacterium]MBQ5758342.1 PHP domain-containing protein [Clostridia bacterium]